MTKRIWKIAGVSVGVVLLGILAVMVFLSPDPIFPPSAPCANPPLITGVFSLEGTEFVFRPQEIRVQSCQKARLTFRNTGDDVHRFKIDSVVDSGEIYPGVMRTIEFWAPQRKGTYPFYDPTSNYRQIGMEGQLIVE